MEEGLAMAAVQIVLALCIFWALIGLFQVLTNLLGMAWMVIRFNLDRAGIWKDRTDSLREYGP